MATGTANEKDFADDGGSSMKTGAELIVIERARQISDEKWNAEHDDEHSAEQLAIAAAVYALPGRIRGQIADARNHNNVDTFFSRLWPWGETWWKGDSPVNGSDETSREVVKIRLRIRELAKAGALAAAEIDRLQRETVGSLLQRHDK